MIEHTGLFIGGSWRAPAAGAMLDVESPATEERIGRVAVGDSSDMEAAIAAARRAFDSGPWPRMSVAERRAIILRAGELLDAHADEVDRIISADTGVIIRYRLGHVRERFVYNANLDLPAVEDRVASNGQVGRIVHDAVGVVGAIVPWNAPMALTLSKILPALLTGCTVILKPPRETPLYAYPLAEAFAAAGIPDGVFNVVLSDRAAAELLVTHRDVDHISFTGSSETGKRIGALCSDRVKTMGLELGGKSPVILLDDVDLTTVAPAVLNGGMLINNGEACAAWTRILVPRRRHDEMVDAFCEVVRGVRIGDPLDPATDLGPMVSRSHREKVEGYIALAQEEGAKLAIGGGRPAGLDRGWYVEPTLIVGADNSMRTSREEIFGPVVSVIPYADTGEAVRIANDSEFGLSAGVFTADLDHGIAIAERIRSGTVGVNNLGFNMAFPFGGYRESGIGRQHGPEALHEYLEIKTIGLPAA
jgi:acyl-CoA reductase-like NAD-dependent aldehyde dehydrogenase